MSTILNELVKIREKLDSDGTYSGSNAGVSETVTQIRELVENGAGGGSGGGFTAFSISYDEETGDEYVEVALEEFISAMGKGIVVFMDYNDGAGDPTSAIVIVNIVVRYDEDGANTITTSGGRQTQANVWQYADGRFMRMLANA